MPVFETEVIVAQPPQQVFDFLARPANLALVSPPEFKLKLLQAPERLALGSRIIFQGSKFGVPQKITTEVTEFHEGVGFTDTQISGPFARFVHSHTIEPIATGSKMIDRIDYQAPGGLVGLFMTNERIRKDLEALAEYRNRRFQELLA